MLHVMRALALVLSVAVVLPAAAHHSFVAFHENREAFIRGTVESFQFRNPHSYFYVNVPQADGSQITWRIEGETRNDLYRNGWREDTLVPGETVTVRINPPRKEGRLYGRLLSIEKADGIVYAIPNEEDEAGREDLVPADSLAGVWIPKQEFFKVFFGVGPLVNETARAKAKAYEDSGALPANALCIDMAIPTRLGRAHVYEIEIVSDELVLIHSEDDAEARRIYLDGRSHPDSIPEDEKSITGYSIGHWEENTLVVDTRHYKIHPRAYSNAPSSPSKRTIERYTLSEDKTLINLDIMLEDPEHLSDSYSWAYTWQHAPHVQRMPHSCDLQAAAEFLKED